MSKVGRPAAVVVAGAVLVGALTAGCSTEVDPQISSEGTADSTSTTRFVATGSTEELFDQLLAEVAGLSEAIVTNEGQRETIARVDAIWAAARPGIEKDAPASLLEFDAAIALLHTGVDRRRPADADKAYNNLVLLVAALP